MESKRGKLVLVLMSVVLLLVLAVGPVVPGVVVQMSEPWIGSEVSDGLHNLLAPMCPGGSGT